LSKTITYIYYDTCTVIGPLFSTVYSGSTKYHQGNEGRYRCWEGLHRYQTMYR